ncbi:MAG: NTP transferase domain-containing protein [Proteobacteria bacterium]|nr:NTP transferase domain-containing protein [Pseudomonadota bacterium]
MPRNTVAFIISRTGSTRVPNKALLDIAGQPLIAHMIRIAKQVVGVDSVWLATTALHNDDALADVAGSRGIDVFRGDPEKVLDRIHAAARFARADTIIYIGGDCPLLDPVLLSEAVREFNSCPCDYLCNYEPPTFPGGMDINVISFDALDEAYRGAVAPSQRVHPFSYLTFHPEDFIIRNMVQGNDLSTYHWSIDYPGDVEFIRLVYRSLYRKDAVICMEDVLRLIRENTDIDKYHRRLLKPSVAHAFFSSPGMMHDITKDINHLSESAIRAINNGSYKMAESAYKEITRITSKLSLMNRDKAKQ